MKKQPKIKVEQAENQKPVGRIVLAQSIVAINKAATELASSGLNRKAIVILIQHKTKISVAGINDVLNALDSLQRDYTTLK